MLKIRLGDELSKCKMVFTGDNYISTYNYKTGSMLIRHINFNKKSLSLFKTICFKKKQRKNFIITKYGERSFSNAFTVNVNSNKIQDSDFKHKLKVSLELGSINDKFNISNNIADINTLYMAYNQLRNKKGSISDKRLVEISSEIKMGKYEFKPLNSYKIPKKIVKLNKSAVKKYLKNKTSKEKLQFYKDMKANKRHTSVVTEYRQIFEENLEGKVVAKAIQIVLNFLIESKNHFPANMFAYRDNTCSVDIIDYLKTKVSKSNLTFMINADIKEFFPSITKKHIIQGLETIVTSKDNKFYHLVKSYLSCGYNIKILQKSKNIGARKIKIITKNSSKYFVYQGTILAPLFSNIVNSIIIKKINKQINDLYTVGHKCTSNKVISRLANKLYRKTINKSFYKKQIKKIKPTCFTNSYKRV
jgi:predicted transcriptional regulator